MQNPELALWRAVLVAGLHNPANGVEPDAIEWLGSDDFNHVCQLTGVDPAGVLRGNLPEKFA